MFKIDELKKEPNRSSSNAIASPTLIKHTAAVKHIDELVSGLPNDGEAFLVWSTGQFNKFTFIPWLIRHLNVIESLIISTYSLSMSGLQALHELLLSNSIQQINIVISDSITFRLPKVYDQLKILEQSMPGRIKTVLTWNHSKILMAKSGQYYITIEGSGNFSENAAYEQYVLFNNQTVYEFRKKCLDSVIAK
jgi:hypothetical protein